MRLEYSWQPPDETKVAKVTGKDLNTSFKHAVEICRSLKGKSLEEAKRLLEEVIEMRKPIPFKRYKDGVGHRKGLKGWNIGKYPKKAASHFLKLLRDLQSNAEYKGLTKEKLRIVHAQAQQGPALHRRRPKGRWRPWRKQLVHIQLVAAED